MLKQDKFKIHKKTAIKKTFRTIKMCSLLEYEQKETIDFEKEVNLPISDDNWNIGLIYGSSGSGKTTIAKEYFTKIYDYYDFDWNNEGSLLDDFPEDMSVEEITGILTSVGLCSVPNYLKPFNILSNGEKYRAFLARVLSEKTEDIIVIDEFTSIVDRQVAKMLCVSLNKAIKRMNKKIVLLSCHSDIIEWLNPDWTYETDNNEFQKKNLQDQQSNSKYKRLQTITGRYSKSIII